MNGSADKDGTARTLDANNVGFYTSSDILPSYFFLKEIQCVL